MSRFSPVPTNAIIDKRLGIRDLSVLSALGCFTDRNGWCTVGMSRLAEALGTTRQTVQRSISNLRTCGYVQTVAQFNDVNGHKVNEVNLTRVLLDFIPPLEHLRNGLPSKPLASQAPLPSKPENLGSITDARGSITSDTQTIQENYSREEDMGQQTGPASPANVSRIRKSEESPEFTRLRSLYPKRAGSQRWGEAWNHYKARLKEGVTITEIEDGVLRYAKYCKRTGIEGTERVQQAATFLGINRSYLEPWSLPRSAFSA